MFHDSPSDLIPLAYSYLLADYKALSEASTERAKTNLGACMNCTDLLAEAAFEIQWSRCQPLLLQTKPEMSNILQ